MDVSCEESKTEETVQDTEIGKDFIRITDEFDSMEPTVVIEGKAEVLMSMSKNVFYNPVQEFNRDLSIAVLRLHAEDYLKTSTESPLTAGTKYENGITILEALSASGLRSIRYAKEIPGVKQIVANDISESAVASIRANALRNQVSHLVTASQNEASLLMYKQTEKFQAVDLDPYGCPSQFLDAAVQCVDEGGLLLVTCTDMGVLSGNSPETCHSKYGAISIRVPACHEMALRIVLQCVESHANRNGRYVVPLLSISADFYVRVFARVFTIGGDRQPTKKLALVYHCVGCHTITLGEMFEGGGAPVEPECRHCGHRHTMGGPIWSGPIHDESFVTRLRGIVQGEEFGTAKRLQGVLAVVEEELNDVPLYYALDKLSLVIHTGTMPMLLFRSALIRAGYRVSFSHANKNSVKTDAPTEVIWDVMRVWVQTHPVKKERLVGAALAILSKPPAIEVSFEYCSEANPRSRQMGLTRFQANPQPNWGPGTRSKSSSQGGEQFEKKKRNQDKYKNRRILSDSYVPPNKVPKTEDFPT